LIELFRVPTADVVPPSLWNTTKRKSYPIRIAFSASVVEPEGLAYADHLLTLEGNQKPASLRSGILRCIKKPSLIGLGFFISLSLRPGF